MTAGNSRDPVGRCVVGPSLENTACAQHSTIEAIEAIEAANAPRAHRIWAVCAFGRTFGSVYDLGLGIRRCIRRLASHVTPVAPSSSFFYSFTLCTHFSASLCAPRLIGRGRHRTRNVRMRSFTSFAFGAM